MRARIHLLTLAFVVMGLGVLTRAWTLQASYEPPPPRIPVLRGSISDRHGAVLAVTRNVESVFLDPVPLLRARRDVTVVATSIAAALSLPIGRVQAALDKKIADTDKQDRHVWLAQNVSPEQSARARALALPGLVVTREHQRHYPNPQLARHVLGVTDPTGRGLEGIELELDAELNDASLVVNVDDGGLGAGVARATERVALGDDVRLTIDSAVQEVVERELMRLLSEFGAQGASAVVLDPRNGEILAMASAPSFDARDSGRVPNERRRDRSIVDVLEPGSTLKPFLLAGALARGVVAPEQRFDGEGGHMAIHGREVTDTHSKPEFGLREALAHSSNIVFVKIGISMGRDALAETLRDFGFGARTNVGLRAEAGGIVREPASWYPADVVAISFGHGVAVTTLQLAVAMGAIANRGVLMPPTLIASIRDGHQRERPLPVRAQPRRVVPEAVALQVADWLSAVVEIGSAKRAAVPGIRVAGKTGSAEQPARRRGPRKSWAASFVGFAPLEAPRLVVAVVVDEPRVAHLGGEVAAPAFKRIVSSSLPGLR